MQPLTLFYATAVQLTYPLHLLCLAVVAGIAAAPAAAAALDSVYCPVAACMLLGLPLLLLP
jgi:hypothetical protein